MRVPNERQLENPWRIHEMTSDFRLEDVWRLREVSGELREFGAVVDMVAGFDPVSGRVTPSRLLWNVRDLLGRWFGLGEISTAPESESDELSLSSRVPDELRDSATDIHFEHLPFTPLYKTPDEFAAEAGNKTMHGVMHLSWVQDGDQYFAQMAVYVKPNGLFGNGYMAFIRPFRYLVVYPTLERHFAKIWASGRSERRARHG